MHVEYLINSTLDHTIGIVTVSPLRDPVCNGSQFEVLCATNEIFLRWEFSVITESGRTPMTFMRTVSSFGPSSDIEPLTINSTLFMFSRISAQDNFPLTSRLLINPVTVNLNGTILNCVEVATSEKSATSINIIQGRSSWLKLEQAEYSFPPCRICCTP